MAAAKSRCIDVFMVLKTAMTAPGPHEGGGELTYTLDFGPEAMTRFGVWLGDALAALDRGDLRPFIQMVKFRPEVLACAVVQDELARSAELREHLRPLLEGEPSAGRPAGTQVNGRLLYYVRWLREREGLVDDDAALVALLTRREFRFHNYSLDTLKRMYRRARADMRFKPVLIHDEWTRSQLVEFAQQRAKERR